jgi:uncharacterized protein YfiM (DUF2279 family)
VSTTACLSPVGERAGVRGLSGLVVALTLACTAHAEDKPFGADKALHFSASAGIAGVAYLGAALIRQPTEGRLTIAIGCALFAGVAKELLDTQTHGDPSMLDLGWDLVGTLVGTGIAWLIDRLFFARPLTPALSPTGERERRGLTPAL